MHTLAFLDPGHFHATLTLRAAHGAVRPEVFVYACVGGELDAFLALVERFNRRAERPTGWRPQVRLAADPLTALLAERAADVVVLAGRNRGKARVMEQVHAAGLHVLADKPWLVTADDLPAIRASLADGPIVREMMTGRRDALGRIVKRLVDDPDLFGGFVPGDETEPAVEQESVHHFEKRVDGVPLRRPPWFFDSRIQGSGAVDIPTHLVDQAQWLLGSAGEVPRLRAARGWSTRVPLAVFTRVTGVADVPSTLEAAREGDGLRVFCNARLTYTLRGVTVRAVTRWEPSTPPGGGDTARLVLRGRAATIRVELGAETAFRRRVLIEARGDAARTGRALAGVLAAGPERPGAQARAVGAAAYVLDVPPALDAGHEAHFAELLDELLGWIDSGHRPVALAEQTLAKYAFLAEAAAVTARDAAAPAAPSPWPLPLTLPSPHRGEGWGEGERVKG